MKETDALLEAARIVRDGGTVVFPTETVYGLGAHALDVRAVARIFDIKNRPRFNPLIVHVSDLAGLDRIAASVPPAAVKLAERFWPGPLTLVLPKRAHVPDLVSAGLPTVAVRVPRHPLAQALLQAADVPIAAPSANRYTQLSPTRVEHAKKQLGERVDFYLDGGPCEVGVESTIVGWVAGRPTLLRRGGLALEDIAECIGEIDPVPNTARPLAPGNCERHYAPKTPLVFSEKPVVFSAPRKVALLALQPGEENASSYQKTAYLSHDGDLQEAASQLFVKLHELESLGLDLIVARPLPNRGLGVAINDRLRRASQGATDL